jgi:hypothetical protein
VARGCGLSGVSSFALNRPGLDSQRREGVRRSLNKWRSSIGGPRDDGARCPVS